MNLKFYCIRNDKSRRTLSRLGLFIEECASSIISFHVYFSVSLKFRACHVTGQWGEFRVENATLCLHILFGVFFVVVFNEK